MTDLERILECIQTDAGTLLVATLMAASPSSALCNLRCVLWRADYFLEHVGKRRPGEHCLVRECEEIR